MAGHVDKEKATEMESDQEADVVVQDGGLRPGGRSREKEGQTRRGGVRAGFFFFFLVGLQANTPGRIVQLRELQKCVIQVRGMEKRGRGGGEG